MYSAKWEIIEDVSFEKILEEYERSFSADIWGKNIPHIGHDNSKYLGAGYSKVTGRNQRYIDWNEKRKARKDKHKWK